MSASMRASFTLTLDDRLSSGLKNIQQALQGLKREGNSLTLGGLERAGNVLRTMAAEVRNVAGSFNGLRASIDRAWDSMKRWSGRTFGAQSKIGAFGAAAEGYSLIRPIQTFAEYQNTLKHSAITGGYYGAANDAEMARLNKMFTSDAMATGQDSSKIAEAYYEMLTGGLSRDTLDKNLGAHTRFATAYNVDVKDAGQLSLALLNNFKLTQEQYEAALGQVGQISKEGLFKVSAYSRFMPAISGQMKAMGMTGPDAALQAISALQIVRGVTGDDSTAATDLGSLLTHIYAPIQERAMRMRGQGVPEDLKRTVMENAGAWKGAFGVDYARYMREQEKAGVNPLDAYVNLIKQLQKSPDFSTKMRIFGQLSHTQEAGAATNALIQNYDKWMRMRSEGKLRGAEVFEKDFKEAMRGAEPEIGMLNEGIAQLVRRLGMGFLPILRPINAGLTTLLSTIKGLDEQFPGLVNGALIAVGSFLAFGAAVAAIGFVMPAFIAGFEMIAGLALALISPLGLVIAAVGALAFGAYELYENWDAVAAWFSGPFRDALQNAADGFGNFGRHIGDAIHDSLIGALRDLQPYWDWLVQHAQSVFDTLDNWTGGGITSTLKTIKELLEPVVHLFEQLENIFKSKGLGDITGGGGDGAKGAVGPGGADPNAGPTPFGDWLRNMALHVTVAAEPGTRVTGVEGSPELGVRVVNPGQATNKP